MKHAVRKVCDTKRHNGGAVRGEPLRYAWAVPSKNAGPADRSIRSDWVPPALHSPRFSFATRGSAVRIRNGSPGGVCRAHGKNARRRH